MNNKVNYTMVGFLVLVGFALILGFSYWLLKPSVDDETKKYNVYFDESILGLNLNAPVKYKGISVGKVSKIGISPNNTEQVEVLITILKTTPIKTDTVAKLTAQGITGLSYINLSMGSNNAPDLVKKEGEKYPSIKTAPSFFNNVEASFGDVSSNLAKTLSETQRLLNSENQEHIAILLKRSAELTDRMTKLLDDETINHFHSAVKNVDHLTYKIDKVTPNVDKFITKSTEWEDGIKKSFDSIMNSYLTIQGTMAEVKRAVQSGEFNVKGVADDVVPTINASMVEMQNLMIKIEAMLDKYERSPGDILFKREEIKKGPGEE